jgi:hypothetical protein
MQINLPILPDKGKRLALYIGLGVLALCSALFAYKTFFYHAPVTGVYQAAKPADGMASAPTHAVQSAPLQAYDKKAAIAKMGIPDIQLSDPKLELVATSRTSKDRQGYITTSAAIANTETGKVEIIEKKERSLFNFGGQSEVGVRAGIGTGGQQAAIYARQDLLRVGAVNLAGYGEANMNTLKGLEAKAMVDVSVRW